MPRVTHVKAAQQRYRTVPVLDADGNQVVRTLGTRTTKTGRVVTQKVVKEDRSQPLPPENCDKCHQPIEVGTPYKWIKPRSGPYGGRKRSRHASCPTWEQWEYSQSLSARIAQVVATARAAVEEATTPDEVTAALEEAASEVNALAEEKRDSASSLEEGFGHPTSQSDELNDIADQLESWASDIESADVPELPDPEEVECETCGGEGTESATDRDGQEVPLKCRDCDGEGRVTPDEPTEEQAEQWRAEVEDATAILDECPV